MSELHRGDPLQVSIETATIDGSGVARVDGQVVFVPGALPGERCSVRIAHVGRSAVFAQLLSVLTPSAHRVEPDCPYFPLCGGCALRHMDYEQELALKQAHVQSCLTRIGGQTISALPITGAAQTDGYRNKVQFPVQEQDGRPVAGFFSGKTHRVIPVRHCRIQPDCADAIRGAVLAWMEQYHIRFLVTKDGGEAGGFREKAAAALAAGVELVVIRRPRDRGEGLEDILAWFQADKEEAEWK